MEKRISVFGFNERYFEVDAKAKQNYSLSGTSPIQKNLYHEHPDVTNRSDDEVQSYMDSHDVTVAGRGVPKPLMHFREGNFPECIERGLSEADFQKPTCIQSLSWPVALSGRDMISVAPEGTGKTLAYVVPSLIHILHQTPSSSDPKDDPIVLILTPTRELALQIQTVCSDHGQPANINSACLFGGVPEQISLEVIEKGAQIYIATPRQIVGLIREDKVSLRNCTFVVIDEADLMLNQEFKSQIKTILEKIRPDRQILMFSSSWSKDMQKNAQKFLVDHIQVKVGNLQIAANPEIKQNIEVVETIEKFDKLREILDEIMAKTDNKTLIFARKSKRVKMITEYMKMYGFQVSSIDHDLPQKTRDEILEEFRNGSSPILVVSDVTARGLDVDGINYVVNYDFPSCMEEYIRRISWTTKSNSSGTAYTLLNYCNMERAKDLADILREANQTVNPKLLDMIEEEKLITEQLLDPSKMENCRCQFCREIGGSIA